jgi:hypothetical protein
MKDERRAGRAMKDEGASPRRRRSGAVVFHFMRRRRVHRPAPRATSFMH